LEERLKGPRNLLLAVIFAFVFSALGFSQASIYFAASAQGSNNGTSCANAYSWTDGTNGINKSAQQKAGNTLHLCNQGGTFTCGSTASNGITTVNAGTSGNPITIVADNAVLMQCGSWGTYSTNPTGGAIDITQQYWTVNGQNNLTIQNTLNGTAGAKCPGGTCSLANPTAAVYVDANNVTVENLTTADMYDRTPCGPNSEVNQQFSVMIDAGASANIVVQGNTMHDADQMITVVGGSGAISNMTFTQNTMYHATTEIVVAEGGGGGSASNFTISFNDIYDNYYWWDAADANHLNGMHPFAATSGTSLNNFVINGNYVHGDFGGSTCGGGGSHTTALIFFETTGGGTGTGNAFINNLLVSGSDDDPSDGLLNLGDPNDSGALVANNTFVGANDGSGYSMIAGGTFTWKNNLSTGLTYGLYANGGGHGQVSASDHNNYYQSSTGWRLSGTIYSPFSTWQAAGYDPNGNSANPNLNSNYTLPLGSPAIGLGANLTSLGITALDTGAPQTFGAGYTCGTGCASRPSSGNWDAGAYPYSTGDGPPNPPTGLTAVVN
jgi:hypothetical protein